MLRLRAHASLPQLVELLTEKKRKKKDSSSASFPVFVYTEAQVENRVLNNRFMSFLCLGSLGWRQHCRGASSEQRRGKNPLS